MHSPHFEPSDSLEYRVNIMGSLIDEWISDFITGKMTMGVQAFQGALVTALRVAGLILKRWVDVDCVVVHPDNREKAMLVPIDVHDLLLRIFFQGWCWTQVDALAGEIPPNETGQSWRDGNVRLVQGADGLLAVVNPGVLEICSVRGSHTTAAVRCMKAESAGVPEEICLNGKVSQSKIVEAQPSMM